jgi:UDP-3-O-[3-hydroxymyristoyl] glucosamine N-acyltransferase
MKLIEPVSIKWLATLIEAEIIGNDHLEITGVNEIHQVEFGDVVFVDHPKYYDTCLQSEATCIIINNKEVEIPDGKALLFCEDPFEAYLTIIKYFNPLVVTTNAISDDVIIGEGSIIMPNVTIANNVSIGKNCILFPGVIILAGTIIGNDVIIQSNTVIGGDAFYYNTKKNRQAWYKKMLSCGYVLIEDKVEIGCSCTIDRGVSGCTKIGMGTKIDNMVHIGHDTQTAENCLIAAQVGIAGGVKLEAGVTIWGQAGLNKTLTIGENAVILGGAGVTSSLAGNKTYLGFPAEEASIKRREYVWIKRIPEIWKKVMDPKA